jgi:GNAT superfamily N-acetyltransferase
MLRENHQLHVLPWPLGDVALEARLQAIWDLVWPPEEKPNPLLYAGEPPPEEEWPAPRHSRIFLLRDTGFQQILAGARIAPRRVRIGGDSRVVLALASVFSHPEYRGRGYGRVVTRAALERVDAGDFEVALFQTPVPEFYQRLNCRLITNPIINSRALNRNICPFWQDHAMIYPANFPWPEGELDLLGPGW